MTEPIYVTQNADLTNAADIHQWFRDASQRGREAGADHFRYSEHPHIPKLVLVEGWKGYPESWNYGEPRWALTNKAAA